MYNLSKVRVIANVGTRGGATKTIPPRRRTQIPNKHWNPLFKKERAERYMKVELLDFEFDRRRARDEVPPEELKEKLKKLGMDPASPYTEKPFYISSTGAILDAYVPVEGDGKVGFITIFICLKDFVLGKSAVNRRWKTAC